MVKVQYHGKMPAPGALAGPLVVPFPAGQDPLHGKVPLSYNAVVRYQRSLPSAASLTASTVTNLHFQVDAQPTQGVVKPSIAILMAAAVSRWTNAAANRTWANRTLRVLVSPEPLSFADRRSVLQVLQRQGTIEAFRIDPVCADDWLRC